MNKVLCIFEVLFNDGTRVNFKSDTEENVKTYVDLFFSNKELVGVEKLYTYIE